MLDKLNRLINSIDQTNDEVLRKLSAISDKAMLSKPIKFIVIDKRELESMTNPDLADKDVSISHIEIDL